MKKILSIILSVFMITTLSTPIYAQEEIEEEIVEQANDSKITISNLTVTIPALRDGQRVSSVEAQTNNENVEVWFMLWEDENRTVYNSSSTFKEGHTYTAKIKLSYDQDTYTIDRDTFTVNGKTPEWWGGDYYYVTVYEIPVHNHSLRHVYGTDVGSLNDYYQCDGCLKCYSDYYGNFEIENLERYKKTAKNIRITVDQPVLNQKSASEVTSGGIDGLYHVYIMEWRDSTGAYYPKDYPFQGGQSYTVDLCVVAEDGYYIDPTTISVNGTTIQNLVGGSYIELFYTFEPTETHTHQLTYVNDASLTLNPYYECDCGTYWKDANQQEEITRIDEYRKTIFNASFTIGTPTIGKKLDYSPVSGNSSLYKSGVVTWSKIQGGVVNPTYIVEVGVRYQVLIAVSVQGDYIIDANTLTINGQVPVQYSSNYGLTFCNHDVYYIPEELETCTEDGYQEHYECEYCGNWFKDAYATQKIGNRQSVTYFAKGHNWDKGQVLKEATLDEEGEILYTCLKDSSHTKKEVIPKVDQDRVAGYSLSVGGNIGVHFHMVLNEETLSDSSAFIRFTMPDGSQVDQLVSDATQEKGHYVFTCYVSAKDITRPIQAEIYTELRNYVICTYTVEEYANYILNNYKTTSREYRVAKTMMTYGKSAQEYFNYYTSSLPDNTNTINSVDFSKYAYVLDDQNDDVQFVGARLLLTSKPGLKLYFIGDGQFNVGSKVVETTKEGKYTVVTITNIVNMIYAFTITTNNFSLKYSVYSYAYQASQTNNTTLKNLVNSMYAYQTALSSL